MNDNITLSLTQYAALIADISGVVVNKTLTELDLLKPTISKYKAYQMHGRVNVDRWIDEGLIKPERDAPGKTWRIDRHQLESVVKASNRHSFINNL